MSQTILVIGGSKGIGLEVIRQGVAAGHTMISASRTRSEELSVTQIEWDALSADLLPDAHLPSALSGLVYCPGNIRLKPLGSLREDDFLEDFRLNVLGGFRVVKQLIKRLKAEGGASCVFYSTVAAGQGMPFHIATATVKAAVEGMARTMAAEFAGSKVRFNVIAPSLTDTPLAQPLLSNDKRREAMDQRHPLGRIGHASEIAAMTNFLLSDEAAWMTGQVIGMDGGMSALKV